jgi:hypothetical protein
MYPESSIWYQATTRQGLISFNLRLAIFASFDFGYFLISFDKTRCAFDLSFKLKKANPFPSPLVC